MKAVRSFVAIECPENIKEEIQKLQQELKMALLGRAQAQASGSASEWAGSGGIESRASRPPDRNAMGASADQDQTRSKSYSRATRDPSGQRSNQLAWTRPEGFHLTLKFLGNVAEDRISRIVQAIRGVTEVFSFFTVSVGEVGVFPLTRSPRVIWVGAKSVGDGLVRLQDGIEKVLGPLGFPPEDRPFHPHLTLGRIKSGDRRSDLGFDKTALTRWLVENQKRECGRFEAKEVLLMKSDLQTNGAVYTPLAKLRLAAQSEASQSEPLA